MRTEILIVDDEQIIVDSLELMFKNEGIDVHTVTNPLKALELYRTNHYPIALIDIMMPQMKGVDLIREIKTINPLSNLIIMTAFSNMEYVVSCIDAGAVDYVTKPFTDVAILINVVQCALERVHRWRDSFGVPITSRNNQSRSSV